MTAKLESDRLPYPLTVPLFFPLPENPPFNSTPAQTPGFPSISPIYLNVPSYPSDSILTLSPISKVRFVIFPKTSECRLGGRAEVGVFARSLVEVVELVEMAEDGRPVTERRPDCE
jgi:hypothetical protein